MFAHHRGIIEQLASELDKYGVIEIKGGLDAKLKFNHVQSFQNDHKLRVLIGQTQAAGEGITLTAAAHVIFAEPVWSPKELHQCADRCHRIGQHSPVTVDLLVTRNSIDAMMLKSVIEKAGVIDALVKEEDHVVNNEKIAELFRSLSLEFSKSAEPTMDMDGNIETPIVPVEIVQELSAKVIAAGNRENFKGALAAFDISKLSELPPESRDAFCDAIRDFAESA